MATEPHSGPADLSCIEYDDLGSRSISELVSYLRTAFRTIDFDKVEEVLVAKEVKLKKEVENKNKECELLQTKYEFLRLDNLTQECTLEQVKVDPKELEKWKKTYEELKEREREIGILKFLIGNLNEDREKNKSALEQSEKLLDDVKKAQEDDKKIIEELKHKNSELQCEIEVVKKTNDEVHNKIMEKMKSKILELERAMEVSKITKDGDEKIIDKLNHKISELECEIAVLKKTEEDDKKTILKLNCEISNLESAKRAVEHDFEQCKDKHEDLERRLLQLENSYAELIDGEPVAPNRNDSKSGACPAGSKKLVGKRGAENDKIENRTGTGGCIVEIISDDDRASVGNLFRPRGNQKRKRGSFLDDCKVYSAERDDEDIIILPDESKGMESLKKVGATSTTPHHCRPAKHVLKKLFSSGTNDSKKVVTSPRSAPVMLRKPAEEIGAECKSHNSKFKNTTYRMDYSSEDWSISSDSDSDTQQRYGSSHLRSKDQGEICNKKWESETEMVAAFRESNVLCMEAVCILYRQKNLTAKPPSADLPSRHRGFNDADVLRGSTLALFLTSGDPQGKLKKSTMELKEFDMSGLVDCRRIAIQHSKQLFEILQNNEDRFLFHEKEGSCSFLYMGGQI